MRLIVGTSIVVILFFFRQLSLQGQELVSPPLPELSIHAGKSYSPPPPIPTIPQEVTNLDAQPPSISDKSYSLEEILSLATTYNPTLRQARTHISAELGKALEAGLYPNPTLSYSAEQIFVDGPDGNNSPGEFQGGIIEQRFVTAGKLQLSRQKYMRRAEVSEHRAMVQQFKVCNDVRIHFYRTLAAAYRYDVRRELLKTGEDSALTVQESYNLGQASSVEVRQMNVALQRARLELLNDQNAFNEEFRRLTALIGVPMVSGLLSGELHQECPQLSYDEALGRLLTQSPEVAAARAKLAVDQITVEREQVEWVPDIVIRGGAGYNFEADQTTGVAGVRLELPLYDWNQGTVQQARADLARQHEEIKRIELDLRDRLASTYRQYTTALQHVHEYDRVILPELKAAYEELLIRYKQYRVRWPDVLSLQRDYFDARLAQVDNLLQARVHEVLIYGFLLHDGLMAAQGVTPPGHIDAVPKPR